MITTRRFPRMPRARLPLTLGLVLLAGCLTPSLTLRGADEGVPAAGPVGAANPPQTASSAGKDRKRHSSKAKAVQNSATPAATTDEIAALKERLNHQEQLLAAQQQQKLMGRNTAPSEESAQAPNLGEVASLAPVIPVAAPGGTAESQALATP